MRVCDFMTTLLTMLTHSQTHASPSMHEFRINKICSYGWVVVSKRKNKWRQCVYACVSSAHTQTHTHTHNTCAPRPQAPPESLGFAAPAHSILFSLSRAFMNTHTRAGVSFFVPLLQCRRQSTHTAVAHTGVIMSRDARALLHAVKSVHTHAGAPPPSTIKI